MGNCHIYEQHIAAAELQITRVPFKFPTLQIKQKREKIEDYTVDDFSLENYLHHDAIKVKMVA
jgi:dihydrofolate reductase/thymidylate synthase